MRAIIDGDDVAAGSMLLLELMLDGATLLLLEKLDEKKLLIVDMVKGCVDEVEVVEDGEEKLATAL